VTFVIETRPYDDTHVARMVDAVQAEYVELYGEPDSAAVDIADLAPPTGLLLVGLLDGEPVAMGGWRRRGDEVAEIKRMYVERAYRGRGLSRLLLAQVERTAREAGVRRLVLNTGPVQVAAVALYESSGYEPVAPFGHYAAYGGALFYGRTLTPVG
jgi:GNAT superfamily N-acetyltransferase